MNSLGFRASIAHKILRKFLVEKSLFGSRTFSSVTQNQTESKNYDIIIVGGGLVGTTFACSIAKSNVFKNKKILLLEGSPPFKGFTGDAYSNRVSALNHGSRQLFESIGAWELITGARYKKVKYMQVWDALSDAHISFNSDNSMETVCFIVENDLIVDSVYKVLKDCPNVEVKYNSRIEECNLPKESNEPASVSLKTSEKYDCGLLVGADGANSIVRKAMAIEHVYSQSYDQMGVVATVALSGAGDNATAWQRFLPTGPIALLPLTESLSSVVWTTKPDHAKQLISITGEEFVHQMNDSFAQDYGKDQLTQRVSRMFSTFLGNTAANLQLPPRIEEVKDKSRACFPLGFSLSSMYVKNGVALIGDAAHRVHPLAGQGLNLGFGDIKCLTEVLTEAIYNGSQLGNMHYLSKYEKTRHQQNVPIMLGIHGLQHIYGTNFSPIVMARSLGLNITNSIPVLKKFFMEKAMA